MTDCPPSVIEVRRDEKGNLDEICAEGANIHLEQMDTGLWWLEIEKDGYRQIVWFRSTRKIEATSELDGVPGDAKDGR